MLPILPPETWDSIIDCLKGDYSTLLICMLVCKSWEPRSRHNLPYGLAFFNRDEVVQVAQDCGNLWKGPGAVLVNGSTLPPPVNERKPIPHLKMFAMMLAGRWTRVEQLSIWDAEWRACDLAPKTFLYLSAFSTITKLRLVNISFPSITTLRRLICCFPNLKVLHCLSLYFPEHGAARPAFVKWPEGISSLELSGSGASVTGIADLLLVAGVVSRLHKLRFEDFIGPPVYVQALVDAAGTSLDTLELDFNARDMIAESAEHPYLSLVPCSRLEYVKLNLYNVCESTNYDWLFPCLSQVTSNIIKTAVILLSIKDDSPVDTAVARIVQDCCARLDGTLSSLPTFPNLQEVILDLRTYNIVLGVQARDLWPQVMSHMPRLCERGILRLKVDGAVIEECIPQIPPPYEQVDALQFFS